MPSIEELVNKCNNVRNEVVAIEEDYAILFDKLPLIKKQYKKIVNRSSEYENGSFIVLVVGPVKSGKSTFVNLIADAYVSPTHFLECTVRPSIISKRRGDDKKCIKSFSSKNTNNKVENIDSIIDYVRGMESIVSLKEMNIDVDEVPLTEINIKEKVELGLQESLSAETLLTSITTPGGQLLQDNVFVMDMPGFDGKYANIDDPVYDTIAQRADLIIFVQSSNSAISKVSTEFLDVLKKNNQNVPVCLVHNFFEAAYWHSKDEMTKNNEEQKDFAIKEIERLGFRINKDHSFCINLGKVKDARLRKENGEYLYDAEIREKILQPQENEYLKMEKELYKRVVSNRGEMQLQNCLNRTKQQLVNWETILLKELDEHEKKIDEYRDAEKEFQKMNNPNSFVKDYIIPQTFQKQAETIVCDAVNTMIAGMHSQSRFTRAGSIAKVEDLIAYCESLLNKDIFEMLDIGKVENDLYLTYLSLMKDVQELILGRNVHQYPIMGQLSMPKSFEISLKDSINIDDVVPHLFLDGVFRKHTKSHIGGYFDTVKDRIIGRTKPTVVMSYIYQVMVPSLQTYVKQEIVSIVDKYYANLNEVKDNYRKQILESIIPEGIELYIEMIEKIKTLLEKIQEILKQI